MPRPNITEQTDAEVIEQYTSRFFRPTYMETPAIPATYDGKYACMIAVAVDTQLTETQMDQLETAIANITGVHSAFVLVGPARIPLDRTPANHDLKIGIEAKFDIQPTPVE